MKRKFTALLAGACLIASALIVAPATVAPQESVSPASAVWLCAIDADRLPYRVKRNGVTGYYYFTTYASAYNWLHSPVTKTGDIYKWVYNYEYCQGYWQFKHSDFSKTS